ncbi:uncharacterized protein LOC125862879 [Solanum stenotomum]|uniref:uncharacterized protein LOC125862879 n=1 Tax=Solanum stenotomum TaxID=172797 RepID=UPI0020CFEDA7|nr:uncharacterized protein LOC125862879 [Solanum stenotomum]
MENEGLHVDLTQNGSGTVVPQNNSSLQGQGIDYNHPLFLSPTDVSGLSLISFQLTGIENYMLWSRSIRLALLGRNKIGLIDGTVKKEMYNVELWGHWERRGLIEYLDLGLIVYTKRLLRCNRGLLLFLSSIPDSKVYGMSLRYWCLHLVVIVRSPKARSQILMMDPLPSINHVYAMVVRDESQKAVIACTTSMSMTTIGLDSSIAMFSKTGSSSSGSSSGRKFQPQGGSVTQANSYSTQYSSAPQANFTYGFNTNIPPPGWGIPNQQHNSINNEGTSTTPTASLKVSQAEKEVQYLLQGCTFTKDQYDHILKMMQQKSDVTYPSMCNTANTGATNHMVSSLDMMIKGSVSQLAESKLVYLPNGSTTQVSHVGCCALSTRSVITNALHLPDFNYNLLSVSQITNELGCSVTFFPNFYVFQDLCRGKVKEVCKQEGGLYLLIQHLTSKNANSEGEATFAINNTKVINMELWHKRLGHVSSTVLARMFAMNKESLCTLTKCSVCPLAKQTKLSFPVSSIKTSACFDMIHVDLWGPYNTPTIDGNKYFLTIVDDFSRMTWLFLLKHKSVVCVSLKEFLLFIKTQFGRSVKVLMSDNGTEFVNSVCDAMFKEMGIIHQRSCPYTPQQNGVAERKHRHLLEVTRAIRFQASIPLRYCGQCVLAAAYLINRLPSSVLNYATPYERPFFTSRGVIFREDSFPFVKGIDLVSENMFLDTLHISDVLPPHLNSISFPPVVNQQDDPAWSQVPVYPALSLDPASLNSEFASDCRRSTRQKHNPIWMKDFVSLSMNMKIPYPLCNSMSYDHLSPIYQSYLAATSVDKEPDSYCEAVKDIRWVDAMKAEIQALESNDT